MSEKPINVKDTDADRQAILDAASNLSEDELAALDPEELKMIDDLSLQQQKRTKVLPTIAAGAASGISSGFAPDIMGIAKAGINSFKEAIGVQQDDGISITDDVSKQVDLMHKDFKQMENDFPDAYNVGETAGNLAQAVGVSAIPIGKGAQLLSQAKGALATATTEGAKQAAKLAISQAENMILATQAGVGAGMGALNAVGNSEDRMSKETLNNAVSQAALGAAIPTVIGGIGKAVTKGAEKIQNADLWKNMFGVKGNAAQKLDDYLAGVKSNSKDFFDEMVSKDVNGRKMVETMDSMSDIADKAHAAKQNANDVTTGLMDKMDLPLDRSDVREILYKVRENLLIKKQSLYWKDNKAPIQNEVNNVFKMEKDYLRDKLTEANIGLERGEKPVLNIGFKDIYRMKQQLGDLAYPKGVTSLTPDIKAKRDAYHAFNDVIDRFVKKEEIAGGIEEGVGAAFKAARIEESKLIKFYELADRAKANESGKSINPFKNLFKTLVTGSTLAMGGLSPRSAVVVAAGVNAASNVPGVDATIALKLTKLSSYIQNGDATAGKLVGTLGNAALYGNDYFKTVVNGEYAKKMLEENPIERTNIDVINKQSTILDAVNQINPDMGEQLKDAIDANDDVTLATIMENVSKLPGMTKYFKPGKGFNGKVTDPADKAEMLKTLETSPISHVQRLQHKKQLINNNIVPVIQVEQPANKDTFTQFSERQQKTNKQPRY